MFTTPRLVVIALCAALNFAVGSVVYLVKLPIYLDQIGTILCALLVLPDRRAAAVCGFAAGFVGIVLTTLLLNPFLIWFSPTSLAIAAYAAFAVGTAGQTFRARPLPTGPFTGKVVLHGVVLGLVAAAVSAPVVAYLFGGVTGSGSAFLVALFLKSGQQLLNAALLSGLTAEPIDKTLQVLVAALLYRATPADFLAAVRGP